MDLRHIIYVKRGNVIQYKKIQHDHASPEDDHCYNKPDHFSGLTACFTKKQDKPYDGRQDHPDIQEIKTQAICIGTGIDFKQ